MTSSGQGAPWTGAQLRFVMGTNLAGLAIIFVGFVKSRTTATLQGQIGWLNLAVTGLVVATSAHGALLLFARGAVGRRRERILPDVPFEGGSLPVASDRQDQWLWVPGTRRAHRLGCPLIAGRNHQRVEAGQIREDALERCEMCG